MARQTGPVEIIGTLGDLIFYRNHHGAFIRKKGTLNKDRLTHDPCFERTRENASEFGRVAKGAKLIRQSAAQLGVPIPGGAHARLTAVMRQLLVLDATSARGQRNLSNATQDPAALELLNGFDFNPAVPLADTLISNTPLEVNNGRLYIDSLVPTLHLHVPPGTSYVEFRLSVGSIDFTNETYTTVLSNRQLVQYGSQAENIELIADTSTLSGFLVYCFGISFLSYAGEGKRAGSCLCIVEIKN